VSYAIPAAVGMKILSSNNTRAETTSSVAVDLHSHTFTPDVDTIVVFAWCGVSAEKDDTEYGGSFNVQVNGTDKFTIWSTGTDDQREGKTSFGTFTTTDTANSKRYAMPIIQILTAGTDYTKGASTTIKIRGDTDSSEEVCCFRSVILGV